MTYEINYDAPAHGDGADNAPDPSSPRRLRPRRRVEVPSILKTGAAVIFAGGVFFGAEMALPYNWKPSHFTGTYDARVTAAVKAAELQQQAQYEAYAESVRLANAQNLEKYKAASQAVLGYYGATYDRAKVFASAVAQIQSQYVNYRMNQAQTRQGTDNMVINYARMWGRFAELMAPGSGRAALDYADALSEKLDAELTAAARNGQTIGVEGWDTNLPSPQEVQAKLEALKPVPLPEPPAFTGAVTLYQGR